ncbi:hypothetical protein COCNU_scaffold014476G000010 [Cocos nucifera]|nr:hypothetical protein [Cocos nucifera]
MYSSVSVLSSTASPLSPLARSPSLPPPKARTLTLTLARSSHDGKASPEPAGLVSDPRLSRAPKCCHCGRRLGLLGTAAAALLRVPPPNASGAGPSDPEARTRDLTRMGGIVRFGANFTVNLHVFVVARLWWRDSILRGRIGMRSCTRRLWRRA